MLKNSTIFRASTAAFAVSLAALSTPAWAQLDQVSFEPETVSEAPGLDAPGTPASAKIPASDMAADALLTEPVPQTTKASPTAVRVTKAPSPSTAIRTTPSIPSADAAPLALPGPTSEIPSADPAQIQSAAAAQSYPKATPAAGSSYNADVVTFGGVLALLVIGAGAMGVSRRRRPASTGERNDAVLEVERPVGPAVRREVDLTPPILVPQDRPAFSWGRNASSPSVLSPTEKAHRGPTPDNPSMSLKKRLKRAAFFERRERDAAAGRATSMSRFAGLPKRMIDASRIHHAGRKPAFEFA